MARAYIGLGSNLGHPRRQLARALCHLAALPRVRMVACSPAYLSAPIGGAPQPDYLNAVAAVDAALTPRMLLARLLAIERRAGRRRNVGTASAAPRTLDLDLLLYGRRRAHSPTLALPHPRMHQRAFVLRPLIDLAPAVTIPGRGLARRYLPRVREQRIVRTRTLPRQ